MPSTLVLQPATINAALGTLSASTPIVSVVNASYFMIYFDEMLVNGEYLKVQYQAIVIDTVYPNEVITQNIYTEYTSVPSGFRLTGRDHTSSNGWATSFTDIVIKLPAIVASVYYTDLPETPDTPIEEVNIGELVYYRATVTMPETLANSFITVTLPTGIDYCSASVIAIGAKIINSALSVGQSVSNSTSQIVVFTFGSIENVADNTVDVNDVIVVQVIGHAQDIVSNFNGVQLTTIVLITTDTVNTEIDTTAVTIIEPHLVALPITSPDVSSPTDAGDNV